MFLRHRGKARGGRGRVRCGCSVGPGTGRKRGGVAPAPKTPGEVRTTLAASGSLAVAQANSGGLWRTPGILRWQKIRPFAEFYSLSRTGRTPLCRTQNPVPRQGSVGSTPTSATTRRGRFTSPSRRPVLQRFDVDGSPRPTREPKYGHAKQGPPLVSLLGLLRYPVGSAVYSSATKG